MSGSNAQLVKCPAPLTSKQHCKPASLQSPSKSLWHHFTETERLRNRSTLHASTGRVFVIFLTCPTVLAQPRSVTPDRCLCQRCLRVVSKYKCQQIIAFSLPHHLAVKGQGKPVTKIDHFDTAGRVLPESIPCTQHYKVVWHTNLHQVSYILTGITQITPLQGSITPP